MTRGELSVSGQAFSINARELFAREHTGARPPDTLTAMNAYHGQPATGPIDAVVTLPGSKSITNRALIVAALADGHSLLAGALLADDTQLMIEVLRTLGVPVSVDEAGGVVEVTGCGGHIPVEEARLYCGNAGTVMRFGTALVALGQGRYELDGVDRMRQRPIGGLAEVLSTLGAGIEWLGEEGFPPLAVHGQGLRGGHVSFDAPESSQLVSALLLAAPYASRDVLIDVTGAVPSKPYLRITTSIMDRFGVSVVEQFERDRARFIVESSQRYRGCTYTIEPDASNATYFLAAPAMAGGRVTVERLGTESIQGDARFVDVLEKMGCRIDRAGDHLTVHGPEEGDRLRGIDVDLNQMPDTVQTLAVLALFAEGATVIRDVANLRVKETDRLAALSRELTKLGGRIEERHDGLTIHPPASISPATIDTYDDHRMAMSFSLAGLKSSGIVIDNPGCCTKTFPDFFERFGCLTARAS